AGPRSGAGGGAAGLVLQAGVGAEPVGDLVPAADPLVVQAGGAQVVADRGLVSVQAADLEAADEAAHAAAFRSALRRFSYSRRRCVSLSPPRMPYRECRPPSSLRASSRQAWRTGQRPQMALACWLRAAQRLSPPRGKNSSGSPPWQE